MKKKLLIVPLLLSLSSLTGCGGSPTEYIARMDSTVALALSNTKVVDKQDYDTDIAVNNEYKDYCQVPNDLYQVTSGGVVLNKSSNDYIYVVENGVGKLHIAGNLITGDVVVDAQAIGQSINISLQGDTKLCIDRSSAAIGESVTTNLHFKDSKDEFKYSVPDMVIVTLTDNGAEHRQYDLTNLCQYHKVSDSLATITIPDKIDDEVIITGSINIVAKSYCPVYRVSVGKTEKSLNVIFSHQTADKGSPFTFDISVTDENYTLPKSLDILVNGRLLRDGDYTIGSLANDETTYVKIHDNIINGNVIISGSGVKKNGHNMQYVFGGLYTNAPDFFSEETPISIKLIAEKGHQLPTADCIRVLIGEKKDVNEWIEVSTSESDKAYLKDDTLYINTTEGDKNKPIVIAARAKDVQLLNYYSSQNDWASIDYAANVGYAPYLFNIGEVSAPFIVNEKEYTIRILDFNRDKNYNAENTAGITFEFVDCFDKSYFSKSGTSLSSTYFMKETGSKFQSEIYEHLNTTVYNALPFKKYINQVDKWTINGSHAVTEEEQKKVTTSNNYLFPLSLDEMNLTKESKGELPFGNKDEKGAYAYYKKDGLSLVKTYQGAAIQYWLRTPNQTNHPQTSIITTSGQASSTGSRSATYGVAPAFCF